MRHTWIRYIAIALLVVMLVGLCACADQFANFNDGMTEEDYKYDPELAQKDTEKEGKWALILLSVFMIVVGIVGLAVPQGLWWLSNGWKFRDAEPSKLSLVLNQAAGGVLILFGAIILIWAVAM